MTQVRVVDPAGRNAKWTTVEHFTAVLGPSGWRELLLAPDGARDDAIPLSDLTSLGGDVVRVVGPDGTGARWTTRGVFDALLAALGWQIVDPGDLAPPAPGGAPLDLYVLPGDPGPPGAPGAPGPPGQYATLTVASAAASWHLAHGFGRAPTVVVLDDLGAELLADVEHNSPNDLTVVHASPMRGSLHAYA